MRTLGLTQCVGIVLFSISLLTLAQPPEGKGKPAHAGPSPFIQFPVPQNSVGVMHSNSRHGHAAAGGVAGKRVDLPALPLATNSFPTVEKKPPVVPECGAR